MPVPSTMIPLGTTAPAFSLPDVSTRETVSNADFDDQPLLLVVFLGNHCPYVLHAIPELARIGRDYRDQGVAMVAISANDAEQYPEDGPAAMVEFAADHGLTVPYLYDESQAVAAAYDAAFTPDIYLFDTDRKLVYRGQLDGSRPRNDVPVDGRDLRAALDAALDGRPIPEPQLPSAGCSIKWKAGNAPDRLISLG